MKLLILIQRLYVGGTQINAIEVAEALRDLHGYDVAIWAEPGELVPLLEQKGLRYHRAPGVHQPWRSIHRSISEVLDEEQPDLVHAWNWRLYMWAYFPASIQRRLPLLVTDMLSEVTVRVLPRHIPTTFGTAELAENARARGRRSAKVLVPPIDTHANSPDAVAPLVDPFDDDGPHLTIVTVTRVAKHLKSESIERTMRTVAALAENFNVRFLLAGEGDAFDHFQRRAGEINDQLGREVIHLTGTLMDPRPVYAMADIVVGMGGSALRGLAFAKPVIVVGANGFAKLVAPDTAPYFLHCGFYGVGDGDPDEAEMIALTSSLLRSAPYRDELSAFGRGFVEANFSLEAVCLQLDGYIENAIEEPTPLFYRVLDGLRSFAVLLLNKQGVLAVSRRVFRSLPFGPRS